jgi:hypothetical protein
MCFATLATHSSGASRARLANQIPDDILNDPQLKEAVAQVGLANDYVYIPTNTAF